MPPHLVVIFCYQHVLVLTKLLIKVLHHLLEWGWLNKEKPNLCDRHITGCDSAIFGPSLACVHLTLFAWYYKLYKELECHEAVQRSMKLIPHLQPMKLLIWI